MKRFLSVMFLVLGIVIAGGSAIAQEDDCEAEIEQALLDFTEYDDPDEMFEYLDALSDEEIDEIFDEAGVFEIEEDCEVGDDEQDEEGIQDEDDDSDDSAEPGGRVELTSTSQGTDADIAAMAEQADRIETNAQGYSVAVWDDYALRMVYIPSGTFIMGADDLDPEFEGPPHDVFLDGYWMAETPVTNAQFARFVEATGYVTDPEQPGAEGCFVYQPDELEFLPTPGRHWRDAFTELRDDHPVVCISRNDAEAYAAWLSDELGVDFVLPTEAQWEKGARGTDGRLYPWGDAPPTGELANFADASLDEVYPGMLQAVPDLTTNDGWADTSPVGSYPAGASPWGLLDMAGNVSEWVADGESEYSGDMITNPFTAPDDQTSVNRGGSWVEASGYPPLTEEQIAEGHIIRSAHRGGGDPPTSSDDHLGFRLAIDYLNR